MNNKKLMLLIFVLSLFSFDVACAMKQNRRREKHSQYGRGRNRRPMLQQSSSSWSPPGSNNAERGRYFHGQYSRKSNFVEHRNEQRFRNNNRGRGRFKSNFNRSKKGYGNTPLHDAVLKGDLEGIEKYKDLISKKNEYGETVFSLNNRGQTALHAAMFARYREIGKRTKVISILLNIWKQNYFQRNKIDFINLQDTNKCTALHLAINQGYVDLAIKLIGTGADVTLEDIFGQTSLHKVLWTTKIREEADCKALFNKILEDIEKREKYREERKLAFLNKFGKDKNGNETTALHLAISQGYVDLAIKLIEAGADVTLADRNGQTSLHKVLLTTKIREEADCKALFNKIVEDVEKREKYREEKKLAFLNKFGRGENGNETTALHLAINQGYVDLAIKLLQAGADVTFEDGFGQTSLHMVLWTTKIREEADCKALCNKILEDIEKREKYREERKLAFLNKLGRDKNGNETTALHLAISQGHVDLAIKLLQAGADIMLADRDDQTSLHIALLTTKIREEEDRKKLFNKIVEDVEKREKYSEERKLAFLNKFGKDENGNASTALHLAISQGYVGLAIKLLQAGVDITLANRDNKTSLHMVLWTTKIREEADRKALFNKIIEDIKKGEKYSEERKLAFLNKLGRDKNGNSSTALHLAISQGYVDLAMELIEAGADVTLVDNQGRISLHMAITSDNIDIFFYLLDYHVENKISLDIKDEKKERTALQWISRMMKGSTKKYNNQDAVRLQVEDAQNMIMKLLLNGARLDIPDKKGCNVVYWVVSKGKYKLLETILRFYNPDSNNGIYNGLFSALSQKSERYAYKKSAYPEETPLQVILQGRCECNRDAIIKVLLQTKNRYTDRTLYEQAQQSNWKIKKQLDKLKEKFCKK